MYFGQQPINIDGSGSDDDDNDDDSNDDGDNVMITLTTD